LLFNVSGAYVFLLFSVVTGYQLVQSNVWTRLQNSVLCVQWDKTPITSLNLDLNLVDFSLYELCQKILL